MLFEIGLASLIVGSNKFTVFALFYFVFEGKVQAPLGAYSWRGDLTKGFLRYEFRGLIYGGAYTWRGLYMEGLILRILRYRGFELPGVDCIYYMACSLTMRNYRPEPTFN